MWISIFVSHCSRFRTEILGMSEHFETLMTNMFPKNTYGTLMPYTGDEGDESDESEEQPYVMSWNKDKLGCREVRWFVMNKEQAQKKCAELERDVGHRDFDDEDENDEDDDNCGYVGFLDFANVDAINFHNLELMNVDQVELH